jgi:ribosomal protein S25
LGGVKKKSLASMEKKQDSKDTEPQAGAAPKGKKEKEQKAAPQQQKRLPFLVPKMTEDDMMKSLAPLRAITVYSASRALGVNASIATGLLRNLEGKRLISKVGGFSGHVVWSVMPKP